MKLERFLPLTVRALPVLMLGGIVLLSGGCASSLIGSSEGREGAESSNPVLLVPRGDEVRKLPDLSLEQIDPNLEPQVRRELRAILRDKLSLRAALKNRHRYHPKLREIFADEGVPERLIDLAFVESGFRASEKSSAGAVGMWQFTKDTGRHYGLEVGLFKDQRKDAILSSIAAARHLYDLYDKFDDWLLAIAAYNAGRGAVCKGLARSGAKSFIDLARSGELPSETTKFVYKFLAVSLMMKEPARYGLVMPRSEGRRLALNLE